MYIQLQGLVSGRHDNIVTEPYYRQRQSVGVSATLRHPTDK